MEGGPEQRVAAAKKRDRSKGVGWAAITMMIAVATLGLHKLISPANPPSWIYEIDLRNYFFPSLTYSGAQLSQGSIPLWAPGQLLGVPFAAALQPAVFYPLLAPFVMLLKTEHALIAHGALHLVLAGLFMWTYLRTVALTRSAALLGALAFMLSPEITHSLYNTAFLSSRTWLPALFAVLHLAVEQPTRGRTAALAGVTAMLLLGGSAQSAVYGLQVAAIYALVLLATSGRWSGLASRAGWMIAGVALGLGLAAIQLGPTLELASDGVRSLEGVSILRAGGLADEGTAGAGSLAIVLLRQLGGAAGIALLMFAFVDRSRRRLSVFFAALLLVTCDFQRGNSGFVFPVYFGLPSGDLFTVSTRIDYISAFAAACLAGFGADWLSRRGRDLPRSVIAVALVGVAAVVIWPRYSDERTPRAWPPFVDLARIHGESALITAVQNASEHDRVFIYQHPKDQRLPPRLGLTSGARVMFDYEPLLPGSYRRYFSIDPALRWRGRLSPTAGAFGKKGEDFAVPMRVLDSLAVRHHIEARGEFGSASRITERKTALPRAYAVDHVSYAASDDIALSTVHDPRFDPLHEVLLTSPVKVLEETGDALRSEVRFISDDPGEVALEATCEKPCVIVLSDLAYPGWHVEVDSRPAESLKANYLLRAVSIPSGTHEIRYQYKPTSFLLGAGLSLLSAAAVLALLVRTRR